VEKSFGDFATKGLKAAGNSMLDSVLMDLEALFL